MQWLSWAEFWYNTSYHDSIRMSPFQALYNQTPPVVPAYEHHSTAVAALEDELLQRDVILKDLKDILRISQNRMKATADKKKIYKQK